MLFPDRNSQAHFDNIQSALADLHALQGRTKDPAPLPHQYVGTMIDNTFALLTAPSNALSGGSLRIGFDQWGNWLSLLQAIHRSFFASIIIGVEKGCAVFCEASGTTVLARPNGRAMRLLKKVDEAAAGNVAVLDATAKLRDVLAPKHPAFADYLEAAMSAARFNDVDRKTWRQFFLAVAVVRNKASHSNSALTDTDRATLTHGGCAPLIGAHGDLAVNPTHYPQIASHALDFCDLLTSGKNPAGGHSA
jgi:hypothetical protein